MSKDAATVDASELLSKLKPYGQDHVLRFWRDLSPHEQEHLASQIDKLDLPLVHRLIDYWVLNSPEQHVIETIEPVDVIPVPAPDRDDARQAHEAGEEALGRGRVGLVLVAGGQGTRLGYDGPKGTFPIGPVTGRTLFEYHADKIRHAQRQYGVTLPWYIMVGETNEEATKAYFRENDYLGLSPENVRFFKQAMMPCVDEQGKFILDRKGALAMNPNGHGGCIPALIDEGIIADCKERGIDILSYFQVDNWAVQLVDPYFLGYHLLGDGQMSSKVKRKTAPREAAGVFCVCDGKVRVIEYTELDIYPQLLDTDDDGNLVHFAGNAAIHVIDTEFIERVYNRYDEFPWHCSHKKIPYVDPGGQRIEPDEPNGYKFETFIFDALVYAEGHPVTLEIDRIAEFALAKQPTGPGGVDEARRNRNQIWRDWLQAAGCNRDDLDRIDIEISPDFANSKEEFVEKATSLAWPHAGPIAIGPGGEFISRR